MDVTIHMLFSFLLILNPFALSLYLVGVMEDLDSKDFIRVFFISSAISLAVFWCFTLFGEMLLTDVLGVKPEALRIFGGVIFFAVGYNYATKGYKTTELLRGSLENLPSEIALPFMIGAGTITQSIIIGKTCTHLESVLIIFFGMVIAFFFVVIFKVLRDRLRSKREPVFDRYVNIMARLNGLIIGAISTDMIVTGTHTLWGAV